MNRVWKNQNIPGAFGLWVNPDDHFRLIFYIRIFLDIEDFN